ncbi:unnamed protein product [Rotaria sordida]|uniref:Protein FAM184A/B N-terminal domain-containing protein n=1 Tax=Rotaria sordida TaxID=392033 RepID=A0A814V635_9BILA|nr:unnamed protein product [Rotaria sordida]
MKTFKNKNKVIYALNTKADEHETIVSNLKQAFEQEKIALASNASSRIDELLRRVEKLSSIKNTQNSLYENKIQLLETEKQNHANELLRIQQSSIEHEHEIAEDFRLKISNLKQNINQIKQSYDERLSNLNKEHKKIIEKLHEEHQLEIDNLKHESKHLFDIENEAQTKFYLQTIEDLKREHNDLLTKQKNQQMTQNELGQEYLKEKNQLEKQIKIFQEQIEQINIKSQLESIEQKNQLDIKINEYKQLQNEFEQYKLNFNSNSNDMTDLNQQLIKQRNEYEELKKKLDKTNREMNTVKERFNRQANELEDKLKLLKDKDSINHQLEDDLTNSRKELELTKQRLRQIEEDQHAQLSQTESTTNYLERRIHELDKTIHQLTVEKQQIMLKYDRELTDLRETYENQVSLCKKEMQNEVDRLNEHYQQLSNDEQIRARTNLELKQQELRQEFEIEKANLLAQWKNEVNLTKTEKNETNQQLNQLKENYTKQIDELKKQLENIKNEYSNIQKQFNDIQSLNSEYKKQIEKLHLDSEQQSKTKEQFQIECDQLKKQYHDLEINSTNELKDKIEKLTSELNEKWSKKFKSDYEKIRKDLTQQKDEERLKAIEEIQRQKQNDLKLAQNQINELEQQLQQIQTQLLSQQHKSKEESLMALQNASEDKRRTINEFQMRIQDLTTEIQRLEGKNQEESLKQKLQLEKEHINQINELKARHMEDIRGQQLAYNTHLEKIRSDHERTLTLEIEKLNVHHQSNIEQLRKDVSRTYSNELEEKERAHSKELAAIRLQLDRALELTKIKEREADLRIEDLTSDLNIKQSRIDNCLRDLNELQEQIEQFRHDIDMRSKELQRVRNETQKEMKHREEKLRNENEEKIRDLVRTHDNEQKQLLDEFSKAHELLKLRISELQSKLDEADERYRNRESRSEDLELMTTLQQTICSYQEQLKKIHDEKKYLKMELINRETNFNKVFTNAPNSSVGVINPLAYNTKFIPRHSDASTSSSRKTQSPRPSKLEPLVVTNGEIPHDLTLNPNKPLLPKRFVK